MIAPPAAGFRLLRYFTLASLVAFVLVAAPFMYLARMSDNFFEQVLREQSLYFKQVQDGFTKQQDETSRRDLLTVHEAGNVNLARLFANALWERDFAPFVAKAQRIPVDRCRSIADVTDVGGRTVQPPEKQACYAGIGKIIMGLPEFGALDAKVFDMMRKSAVFKIKVYDLRGITVYSSEHKQIGEDKLGNAGWQSATAGKPASVLTHRDKFNAFESVVENRDLIESYVPVVAASGEEILAVFEVYSDVTQFLEQIKYTSTNIKKMSADNQAHLALTVAANEAKGDRNAKLLLAVVLGLLALLYFALFVIVRYGQRIIDREGIERERAEQALRDSAQSLRLFADNVPAMAVSLDENLRFLFANKRYAEFFGFDPADVVGKRLSEIVGEEVYREIEGYFAQALQGHPVTYQRTRKPATGESRYLEVKLLPHVGDQGKVMGCFVVITDITEHKLAEERIQRVAHHDSLTGLPNRLLFDDRLGQTIRLAKRDSRQFALLYLDLDRFKAVNDTMGHTAGDELLQAVAVRIRGQVRESDTVARVGGDEFTVILPGIARGEEAETVARKIIATLVAPFQIDSQKQSISIGTSIGIALYPSDAQDADALIKAADAAMYSAKQARSGYRLFDT